MYSLNYKQRLDFQREGEFFVDMKKNQLIVLMQRSNQLKNNFMSTD